MDINDALNIIENKIDEYKSKANEMADSDPKLCEELNIKALALFDIKNEIKEKRDIGGKMMKTEDASLYLGITVRTLLKWTKEGKIKAYKLSKYNYYKKSDLDALYNLNI